MSEWFYLNGEFIKAEKAVIPITQTGFQRSYGIFDQFRTDKGQPRFLSDYLNRFERSQKFLNLSRLVESTEIEEAVKELQARNQFDYSTFKLVLLGDGPDTTDRLFEPLFYIVNKELDLDSIPADIGVITHEYLREFAEVKSLNYLNSYALHRKRIAANAGEVLYHRDGLVSEASRSNVYAIKDGRLITPADNVLHGITRMHLLKLVQDIMPVNVGQLSLKDLFEADEVFVSSTLKEVMPVRFVDDKKWPIPGPLTAKIKEAFREYTLQSH